MSRAERLFGLARYLQRGAGRTLREMAEHFEVSERTIFRDLAALEEQGIPIAHLDGGRYRVETSRPVAPSLDSTDLALVRVALADAPPGGTGPLSRRWSQLVEKLEAVLRGRADGGRGPVPGQDDEVRAALEEAIEERRPVTLVYRSLSGGIESERRVEPWRLLHRAGGWYLVGRCRQHGEPRLFRIERIRSVDAAGGRFAPPADLALETFLDDAWRTYLGHSGTPVVLRLSRAAASALPAIFEPTAAPQALADGTVELCARTIDLDAAASWLGGQDGEATVVEPRELRVRVRRRASGRLAERVPAAARRGR